MRGTSPSVRPIPPDYPRDCPRPCLLATILTILTLVGAHRLAATTADDLCSPSADPCVFMGSIIVDPGSIIDVGPRTLQLVGNASLSVREQSLTIVGNRVVAGTGVTIRTSGATRSDAAADLTISASQILYLGTIDARGSPAGDVTLTADGPLTLSGDLRGRAEAADESAASVRLTGAAVVLSGAIDLDGGRDEAGGDLIVEGASVSVRGLIDVSGGDGGTVDIAASSGIEVGVDAAILADATTAAGDGGDVSLESETTLDVLGGISVNGRTGGDEGGGDGGAITLSGDDGIVVGAEAVLEVLGGSPDGLGGDIELVSLFGSIDVDGSVSASADERDGLGGSIDIGSDAILRIAGTLEAVGALGGGGDVVLDSVGDMVLESSALVSVRSTRPATAGSVRIDAGGSFASAAEILASSSKNDEGSGGSVAISACGLTLASSSRIESLGPGGANSLTTGAAMQVAGALLAGPTNAGNALHFPLGAPTPAIVSGSVIAPAPTFDASIAVPSCQPLPVTPSPTPTQTRVATATQTAVATPTFAATETLEVTARPTSTPGQPACPGDCDDNGVVTVAELVRAVNIALGTAEPSLCEAADADGDGRVAITELVRAVTAALDGCP